MTPGCSFVLVAAPERIQFPAERRAQTAVAKTRITVSKTRPQFEKRILEERRPLPHTHVNDDWFVLLDVGAKESGIFLFAHLVLCFAYASNGSNLVALPSLHETLINIYRIQRHLFTRESVHRCQCTFTVTQRALTVLHHTDRRNNAFFISPSHQFNHLLAA